MKKTILFITLSSLIFINTLIVNAHPGNTDSNGGHYCWTNCEDWGEVYGEWHSHNEQEDSLDTFCDYYSNKSNEKSNEAKKIYNIGNIGYNSALYKEYEKLIGETLAYFLAFKDCIEGDKLSLNHNYIDAIKIYKKISARFPDDIIINSRIQNSYYLLGFSAYENDEFEKAIDYYYESAIIIGYKNIKYWSYRKMGEIYLFKLYNNGLAKDNFLKALELASNNEEIEDINGYLDIINNNSIGDLLADNGIIKKQDSIDLYNLNKPILRQEVVGIALKLGKINIDENYTCKGIYKDVTSLKPNNWACKTIETGAESGIISKDNKYFRPEDYISRAEALAILMRASKIVSGEFNGASKFNDVSINWQINTINTALDYGYIDLEDNFRPNENATRGEIFEMIKRIKNLN